MIITRIVRQASRRRGTAVVEMALILPVFMGVVLGIVEFGRALMVGQLVTNAAREGARLAVVDGSTNSSVETFIKDFLVQSADVGAGDVAVTITITPAPGNTDPGNSLTAARAKDVVSVRVQVPFDKVSYVTGSYLEGKNLIGLAAMRHE